MSFLLLVLLFMFSVILYIIIHHTSFNSGDLSAKSCNHEKNVLEFGRITARLQARIITFLRCFEKNSQLVWEKLNLKIPRVFVFSSGVLEHEKNLKNPSKRFDKSCWFSMFCTQNKARRWFQPIVNKRCPRIGSIVCPFSG